MKFRPTALWRMRISPGPGSPTVTSTSLSCSGPPGWSIWMARVMSGPYRVEDSAKFTSCKPLVCPDSFRMEKKFRPASCHESATLAAPNHDAPATVVRMTQRLTPGTAALLTIPPLLWAGNAVVGRLVQGLIPPVTLNFLRWVLAFAILLPLAAWVLRPQQRPVGALAALCPAGPAGRGRLQRTAIPGAEDLHAAQRDAGGVQHPAVDAGHRRAVLRRPGDTRRNCWVPRCPWPVCWWCSRAGTGRN